MKACHNCRRMWADEYEGQCTDCGASMAGHVSPSGGGDMKQRYAAQLAAGSREANMEQSLKTGAAYNFRVGSGGVPVNEHVMNVAKIFLQPKEGAFTEEDAA